MKVEVRGEERAARPLSVRILQRQKARTEAFGRNPGPRCLPDRGRRADQVALDLPAQYRIGVQQPGERGIGHHGTTLSTRWGDDEYMPDLVRVGCVFRPDNPPEALADAARVADDVGLDELWLWEDCFLHGGLTAAAVALANTTRLVLGIGVLPVPFRNVALTAMEIATLERTFPGRLRVGIGHGIQDWMAQVGARVASPLSLLREYTTALSALLRGEALTVAGRYVTLSDVRLDWPPPTKVDLLLAATGPKTLQPAGSSRRARSSRPVPHRPPFGRPSPASGAAPGRSGRIRSSSTSRVAWMTTRTTGRDRRTSPPPERTSTTSSCTEVLSRSRQAPESGSTPERTPSCFSLLPALGQKRHPVHRNRGAAAAAATI